MRFNIINNLPLYVPSILVLVLILLLTLLPVNVSETPGILPPWFDKLVHVIMMAVLAWVMLTDVNRIKQCLPWWGGAIIVTLIGGCIEILQEVMGLGRTADTDDFVADLIGAFIASVVFYLCDLRIRMVQIPSAVHVPSIIEKLYYSSFPEDERRPWDEELSLLRSESAPMRLLSIVTLTGRFIGFMTVWCFEKFYYLEHFAIMPESRGRGYGSKSLALLLTYANDNGIVLEVEPPKDSSEAKRRVLFYQRDGFKLHESFDYIQPPYAHGLQPVELKLMTHGMTSPDLRKISNILHERVYQKR